MTTMQANATMSGKLNAKLIGPHAARSLRIPGVGRIILTRDEGQANIFAREVFASHLTAVHLDAHGDRIQGYDLGSGVVTSAGVVRLAQDTATSAGAAAFNIFKYHGSGTGVTGPVAADTALQTAIGTTATASSGNTNGTSGANATVTSVATVSYSSGYAVTEWGLFSQATLSGATMWDHRTFGAINVGSGDSIQFTYVLTVNSGG